MGFVSCRLFVCSLLRLLRYVEAFLHLLVYVQRLTAAFTVQRGFEKLCVQRWAERLYRF